MGITKTYTIEGCKVPHWIGESFAWLKRKLPKQNTVYLTDENIFSLHASKFKRCKTIVVPAGEKHKQQATVDDILNQLVAFEADRSYTLVAVGGGVITDMGAYAAAIYMRGISSILVPTSLLCMVDAAMGGKNGVDIGKYKNLVGTIRQPAGILYDVSFLTTLPQTEWQNGFAEIIKHACIKNASLFRLLEKSNINAFRKSRKLLTELILANVVIKNKIVVADPREKADRKLLNFGHTIGHAIENELQIAHGQAVAIGMVFACHLSAQLLGFKNNNRVMDLIEHYDLPTHAAFDAEQAVAMIRHDKKRTGHNIQFVLLEKIGKAVVVSIPIDKLSKMIQPS